MDFASFFAQHGPWCLLCIILIVMLYKRENRIDKEMNRRHDLLVNAAADVARMREWCAGEVGCAYDWLGIFFSQIINFGWHTRNRYFCGEVCTAALQVGGLPFSLQPQRYAPGDLFVSITTKLP
jgi:hypothetical protein